MAQVAVPYENTLKFLKMTSDIIFPYKIMVKSHYNKFMICLGLIKLTVDNIDKIINK